MGYYFEKARSLKDLTEEQQVRYHELRSPDNDESPPELVRRYEEVKAYIGPIFNGETWSAFEELIQDAVVCWILAEEDPSKIQWSNPKDLTVPTPEPTEEEKTERTRAWNEKYAYELSPEGQRERIRRLIKAYGYHFAFRDDLKLFSRWERFKLYMGWY